MAAVPWVALIGVAGLRSVDSQLEEVASLDAGPARVLGRVTLPAAAPSLAAAALWVAAVCAAEMTVTDLYAVRTFAEEVYTQAALGSFDFSSDPAPTGPGQEDSRGLVGLACGVGVVLAIAAAALALLRRTLRGVATESPRPAWRASLGGLRPGGAIALGALMLLTVGVPIASLAREAGVEVTRDGEGWQSRWSAVVLARRVAVAPWEHRRELAQSAAVGVAAATAAVAIGASLAWRMRAGAAPATLLALAAMLAVPGPLLGLGIIRLLNQPPDSLLWPLAWFYDHTQLGPWIAQTVRATPIAALVLWPPLASVPAEAIDAARSEGAGAFARLWRVAAPMRWPALAAAWLVALAVAVGELSATILVVPPGTPPLSVRVFSLLHYGVEDRVAAICLAMMAVYAGLTAAALALWRRALTVNDQ